MENQFDITIKGKGQHIESIIYDEGTTIVKDNKITTFERLGEPLKLTTSKQVKPKRKIRKIFIWSFLIQVSILITMELFFRTYFFKVLLGWLIAVTGFILIPSIKRRKQNVQ